MPTNNAIPMNVAENRRNIPMTVRENANSVQLAVAESGTPGSMNRKADKVTGATAGNFAGLDASGNLTDSGKAPEDFLEAPATAGTSGQVLTSDGSGGQSWQDPTGGDPTEIIDDTAGAGDTDKVWSADKSASEAQSLMTEINSMPTEETGQELLAAEFHNTGLTDTAIMVLGMILNAMPQDDIATDIMHSISLECERLDAIYENWMSERSA